MNARVLVTVGTIAALAAPAGASARLIPGKHPTPQVAKHVVKRHVAPRVLCICTTIPASALPVRSEVELEALMDVELIAHGLEPGYAAFQTTPTLQAQYDAVLIANGLDPYFKGTAGAQSPAA